MNWPLVSRKQMERLVFAQKEKADIYEQNVVRLTQHNKSLKETIGVLRSDIASLRKDKQQLEQQVIDLRVSLEVAKNANAKPGPFPIQKQRPEPANWVQSRDRLEKLSHTEEIREGDPEQKKQEAS